MNDIRMKTEITSASLITCSRTGFSYDCLFPILREYSLMIISPSEKRKISMCDSTLIHIYDCKVKICSVFCRPNHWKSHFTVRSPHDCYRWPFFQELPYYPHWRCPLLPPGDVVCRFILRRSHCLFVHKISKE